MKVINIQLGIFLIIFYFILFYFLANERYLGYCNNSSCDADGQLVVHRWGFKNSGVFNYHDNEDECYCPLCGKYFRPITCGFTNCEWKVTGSKKNSYGGTSQKVNTGWQVALSDGYTTFNDNLTQLAIWDNLQIEVKSLSSGRASQQVALYY